MHKIYKMKKLVLLALFTISQLSFSQNLTKEKLKEKLGKELCEDISTKTITEKNFEFTLGLSMMKVIKNNKAEVEHHYGTVMFGEGGVLEKIGEDMGEQMITVCPDVFEKMQGIGVLDTYIEDAKQEMLADTSNVDYDEEYEEPSVKGKFLSSKLEAFKTIQIEENNGDISKYILLHNFENSNLILQNKLKVNDKVQIYYYEDIVYDPKQNKFLEFKVLTDIQKI